MKQLKLYQNAEFKLASTDEYASVQDINHIIDKEPEVLIIEGYASVFLDSNGKRVVDRDMESVNINFLNIDNFRKNPVVVMNHQWSDVVGRVTEMTKDAKGLFVKCEIHKITNFEHVFEAVQKGLIRTFSIGFIPHELNWLEDENILEISSAEMVELSLAPVPANQDAIFTVTGQKSLSIDGKLLAKQNDVTCDEIKGMCNVTTKKGRDMNVIKKDAEPVATETPAAEPVKQEPAKVEPTVMVTPATVTNTVTAEPSKVEVSVDQTSLVAAIMAAREAEEAAKRQAEQEAVAVAAREAEALKQAEEQKVKDALEYIAKQRDAIAATDAGDLDVDSLSEFYELITTAAETIENKIREGVAATQTVVPE